MRLRKEHTFLASALRYRALMLSGSISRPLLQSFSALRGYSMYRHVTACTIDSIVVAYTVEFEMTEGTVGIGHNSVRTGINTCRVAVEAL